jgi:hypothetical protein
VKDGVVIKILVGQVLEIFNVPGSFIFKKFQLNAPVYGFDDCNFFTHKKLLWL